MIRNMIKRIRIKNTWLWPDTGQIELAPMTLFFGKNGVGKTAICEYIRDMDDADPGSVIILDKPETGLHPESQMSMADMMIDAIIYRDKRTYNVVQLIIETHSEYFLRRIQRRIAEGVLPPNDIAAYHVQRERCEWNPVHGATIGTIDRLIIDTYGHIHNWPKDFFGDEMGEIIAQSKAAIKKRS
jgi:predicted ATPase